MHAVSHLCLEHGREGAHHARPLQKALLGLHLGLDRVKGVPCIWIDMRCGDEAGWLLVCVTVDSSDETKDAHTHAPTATDVMPYSTPVPRPMAPSFSQCCRFSLCVIC